MCAVSDEGDENGGCGDGGDGCRYEATARPNREKSRSGGRSDHYKPEDVSLRPKGPSRESCAKGGAREEKGAARGRNAVGPSSSETPAPIFPSLISLWDTTVWYSTALFRTPISATGSEGNTTTERAVQQLRHVKIRRMRKRIAAPETRKQPQLQRRSVFQKPSLDAVQLTYLCNAGKQRPNSPSIRSGGARTLNTGRRLQNTIKVASSRREKVHPPPPRSSSTTEQVCASESSTVARGGVRLVAPLAYARHKRCALMHQSKRVSEPRARL